MILMASFVEGIMSMVRVRICSKGFLIAPLVGAMDDCFLIQHALQRDKVIKRAFGGARQDQIVLLQTRSQSAWRR